VAVRADLSAAVTVERQERSIRSVLGLIQRQGEHDVRVEDAKGTLASSVSVQWLFKELDRSQKGYVTDTDLWNFVRDGGSSTSLRSITALVCELQLRLGRDRTLCPGHLSMRELCILIFPAHSTEFELAHAAFSDHDMLFKLHLHRRLVEDVSDLSNPVRYQLHHLIDVAASAAEQIDGERKQLNILPGDVVTVLNDAFNFIADGRTSFSQTDLRRALAHHHLVLTSQEVNMLWRRYQPLPFHSGVRFPDFVRQLKPL